MSKTLLFVLNKEIAAGKAINSLAHLALGLGHFIPPEKEPNIEILFSSAEPMRNFKAQVATLHSKYKNTIVSDFVNTMTEGSAEDQMARTKLTLEKDLQYYGICIGGEDDAISKAKHALKGTLVLKDYKPSIAGQEKSVFDFTSNVSGAAAGYSAPPAVADHNISAAAAGGDVGLLSHKAIIALTKNTAIHDLLNYVAINSLRVGSKADFVSLRLLDFVDADGGHHPNISYHPFPILKAKSQTKLQALVSKTSEFKNSLHLSTSTDKDSAVVLACLFGFTDEVEECANRKEFSLLSIEIPEDEFVNIELGGIGLE